MKYLLSLLLIASFFFISCSSSHKAVVATSTPFHLPDTLAALPASEIDIPIKIYAKPLLARVDSMVPKEFTSDVWPNYSQPSCDFRYKYRFVRSALNITCTNNKFGVQFMGNYQIAGSRTICAMNKPVSPWISGSCGFGQEPMRRMNISISSQMNFLPAWHITTASKLEQLQALDKCEVSLFSSDVTQEVADSVKASVAAFCSTMDETIAGMDFSTLLQQTAVKAYHKMAISNYGFITLNPSAIRVGRLNYAKDTFSISVGLSCHPHLSSDSSNGHTPVPAFPPLTPTDNRDGVFLYMDVEYDYAFLTKLANDTLHNKVFEIDGRTIVIKDVLIRGIGNHQLEVRIDFAGSKKGRISLRGTPVLDVAKQTLTIPDIAYSLESKDIILNIGESLFRNKIRKTLEGKSYLDIGALVKTNLPVFDSQLNRPIMGNFFLAGKTKEVKLLGLLVKDNTIQVQVYVNSNMAILAAGLPK